MNIKIFLGCVLHSSGRSSLFPLNYVHIFSLFTGYTSFRARGRLRKIISASFGFFSELEGEVMSKTSKYTIKY